MRFKAGHIALISILTGLLGVPDDGQAREALSGRHKVSATYYANSYRGRPTASGERYDPHALTAAHPSLPLGTVVQVTRPANGRKVVVRINDRNGGQPGIDLSEAAARKLDLLRDGRDTVLVVPLEQVAERR